MDQLDEAFAECRGAFEQGRTFELARQMVFSALGCLGRHTVTGMLAAGGRQFRDWTAAYRLFGLSRIEEEQLWAPLRRGVGGLLEEGAPFVAALDDTLLVRTGRKVSGASWRRDPQGPPFQANLVWAGRYVQTVGLVPERIGPSRARAVPVGMRHAPGVRRPRRDASEAEKAGYRVMARQASLSAVGAGEITRLRQRLDEDPDTSGRHLVVAVDGGYTNSTVLRHLPERTAVIGRVRKDARLFAVPGQGCAQGRPRVYGERVPTPEQLRQDDNVPWQQVRVWAAGKVHDFEVKALGPVRWKGAGRQDLLIVAVRPLAYRPKKGSNLLYRQPAYLIATDPEMPLEQLLQAYVWRWEVEVAFREEKTLLGMGQAQVRTKPAVESVPAFMAAAYGYLHLAAARAGIRESSLARPKWQKPQPDQRCSTGQLISLLRSELWAKALGQTFVGFAYQNAQTQSRQNSLFSPFDAAIYAHG